MFCSDVKRQNIVQNSILRFRYLRVDPLKHLESVIEQDGIQVIELRNDHSTNGCVAGGVECCDLTSHTVARRLQTSGQLYHEKVYFVKHFDDEAFAEFPKEREVLGSYSKALHAGRFLNRTFNLMFSKIDPKFDIGRILRARKVQEGFHFFCIYTESGSKICRNSAEF